MTVTFESHRAALHAAALMGVCLLAVPLAAQGVAQDVRALGARVGAAGNGIVRFSYAAREGVCGNGSNVVSTGRRSVQWEGERHREWESDCEPGPVRISLTVRDGAVTSVRSYVGGRWRAVDGAPVTDLGTVGAPTGAAYLLDLAARLPADPAEQAIFPATLADSATLWPALLRLARDDGRATKVRQTAVFWVGQAAGDAATRGLSELVDEQDADLQVRERAVFALSQRPVDEAVPALIRVARTNQSPRLRQRAIFWLGQTKDPRALAFFEEVLGGKG